MEAMQGCKGFPSLEGEVVVNEEAARFTIAQLLVSSAFGDTNYQFQIETTMRIFCLCQSLE